MNNLEYVVVYHTNLEKLAALVNEQIKEADSVRPCGAPFRVTEKDGTSTWYQGLFVVKPS